MEAIHLLWLLKAGIINILIYYRMNISNYIICSNEEVMKGAKILTNINDVPDEVKIALKQATLQKLRNDRNKLLIDTDKYMVIPDLPDINHDKIEQLKVYRQQLRDYMNNLPNINGFDDIIPPFPIKPEFIK